MTLCTVITEQRALIGYYSLDLNSRTNLYRSVRVRTVNSIAGLPTICYSGCMIMMTYQGIIIKTDNLRTAIIYGVEECQAKSDAMDVLRSRLKDWFLFYLSYFGLNINDDDYFDSYYGLNTLLHHTIYHINDRLLRFFVEECNTDANVRDKCTQQTALICACDGAFTKPSTDGEVPA